MEDDSLRYLTFEQASVLLNVPHEYFIKLVRQGTFPAVFWNGSLHVITQDVLDYKATRDTDRHEALNELTRISQELGLYDDPKK